MRKGTATAVATTCLGLAAASTAFMLTNGNSSDIRRRTRRLRKNTGKALRQVGSFIEQASYMMK